MIAHTKHLRNILWNMCMAFGNDNAFFHIQRRAVFRNNPNAGRSGHITGHADRCVNAEFSCFRHGKLNLCVLTRRPKNGNAAHLALGPNQRHTFARDKAHADFMLRRQLISISVEPLYVRLRKMHMPCACFNLDFITFHIYIPY